ncbi:Uncharacterised protein [Mycobacteroides abscessus]|nr:Uncharacterised protein [Mycobacteroides abscessus]
MGRHHRPSVVEVPATDSPPLQTDWPVDFARGGEKTGAPIEPDGAAVPVPPPWSGADRPEQPVQISAAERTPWVKPRTEVLERAPFGVALT